MLKAITFAGTNNPRNTEDRHFKAYGIFRDYSEEARRFVKSAEKVGVTGVYFTMSDLESMPEYKENPKTFEKAPFHWAFKPTVIWHTLNHMEYGDYVLYADSNYVFRKYPDRLIQSAFVHDIYTYDHSPNAYYPNKCWTYRDTFVKMGCDEEKYWNAFQYHADVLCIRKNNFTMAFVEEWKNFTCDYETIAVNKMENFPCYNDHRDDQSVFSILVVKHNIPASRNPADTLWEEQGMDLDDRKFATAIL